MKGSVIISTHKIKCDQVYYKIQDNWVFCGVESATRTGFHPKTKEKIEIKDSALQSRKKLENSR